MESNDFVTAEQIAGDVATMVNDESYSMFDKGYYLSLVHDAVTVFALDTYYQKITKDIFNWNDGSDTLEMLSNAFNIREIYLHNTNATCPSGEHKNSCNCSGKSSLEDYVVVHWKRNLSSAEANLKTARIKKGSHDPVLTPSRNGWLSAGDLYYCNLQNGRYVFSCNCEQYKHIRFVYNGLGSEKGELPVIPRIIKDGVTDYVELQVLNAFKTRDKKYRTDYLDTYNRFYGSGRRFDVGSKKRCQNRIKKLDTFKKNSLMEYIGNADIL